MNLVIGADCLCSNVRRLALDPTDECLYQLGVVIALFSAPNPASRTGNGCTATKA